MLENTGFQADQFQLFDWISNPVSLIDEIPGGMRQRRSIAAVFPGRDF